MRKTVLLLLAGSAMALATTPDSVMTFDASGTFNDGATLTGTLDIDVTAGVVTSADLLVSAQTLNQPFVPPGSLLFTFVQLQGPCCGFADYDIKAGTATSGLPYLALVLPTTTLVGYDGGEIGSLTQPANSYDSAIQYTETDVNLDIGSLTPTPEPSTSLFMATSCGILIVIFLAASRRGRAHGSSTGETSKFVFLPGRGF